MLCGGGGGVMPGCAFVCAFYQRLVCMQMRFTCSVSVCSPHPLKQSNSVWRSTKNLLAMIVGCGLHVVSAYSKGKVLRDLKPPSTFSCSYFPQQQPFCDPIKCLLSAQAASTIKYVHRCVYMTNHNCY